MSDTELQPTKLVPTPLPGASPVSETKLSVDPTPPGSPTPGSATPGSNGSSAGRPAPLAAGVRLGGFTVVAHLGRGGMGDVYRAHDETLDRDVALKTIAPSLAMDPEFVERFRAEAKAAARIQHPSVVQVYSAGEAEGTLFFAMELVPGKSLGEVLRARGPLPWAEVARLGAQVARALEAAHAQGVIHRDVKPENILVTPDGTAKVADFGLAKRVADPTHTASGVIVGTPRYMSPEQAQGEPLDARSDMYSLGATLFHLVAGQPVFDGSTPMKICLRHIQEPPPDVARVVPDLPEPFARCVSRLLAKRREDRYASHAELVRELETISRFATETERLPASGARLAAGLAPGPLPASPRPAPSSETPAPGTPGSGSAGKLPLIQVVKRADGGVEVGVNCPVSPQASLSRSFIQARAAAPRASRGRRASADLVDLGHLWLTYAALSLLPLGEGPWAIEIPTIAALAFAYAAMQYLTRRGGTFGERLLDVRLVARDGGLPPHTSVGLGYVLAKGFPLIVWAVALGVGGLERLALYHDERVRGACGLLALGAAVEWGLGLATGLSFRDRVFKGRVIDVRGLPHEDDWI